MNLEKLYYYRKQEKHYTAKILEQLLSVWKSKTYLQMGYPTIYKFLVQHLQYSEHEANARIAALHLMKRSTVAAKEVSTGKISPSSARIIEQHLKEKEKTTKLTQENIATIVKSVRSLSMRKTDQKLQTMLQTKARKTPLLYIHESLQIKLDRVKQQYNTDLSNSELIEILLEEKLKDPRTQAISKRIDFSDHNKQSKENISSNINYLHNNKSKNTNGSILKTIHTQNKISQSQMAKKQCKNNIRKKSRYIPKLVKQKVWFRSQGKCEHINCNERRNLEYDHIVPYSKEGPNTIENIQLLCRAHNQWKGNLNRRY